MAPVPAVNDSPGRDLATAQRLDLHRRRATAAGLAGPSLLIIGALILDRYGAKDAQNIESVWDVVGGGSAGIGVSLIAVAAVMLVHQLRWRRILRGGRWVDSACETASVWWLVRDRRMLIRLPDFDAEMVYSMGVSGVWNRALLAGSPRVHVAGRPGGRIVIRADDAQPFISARAAHTRWDQRRRRWAFDNKEAVAVGPIRRWFGR